MKYDFGDLEVKFPDEYGGMEIYQKQKDNTMKEKRLLFFNKKGTQFLGELITKHYKPWWKFW